MDYEERTKYFPPDKTRWERVVHWAYDDGMNYTFSLVMSLTLIGMMTFLASVYGTWFFFFREIPAPPPKRVVPQVVDHKLDGTAGPSMDTRFKFPLTPKMMEKHR